MTSSNNDKIFSEIIDVPNQFEETRNETRNEKNIGKLVNLKNNNISIKRPPRILASMDTSGNDTSGNDTGSISIDDDVYDDVYDYDSVYDVSVGYSNHLSVKLSFQRSVWQDGK